MKVKHKWPGYVNVDFGGHEHTSHYDRCDRFALAFLIGLIVSGVIAFFAIMALSQGHRDFANSMGGLACLTTLISFFLLIVATQSLPKASTKRCSKCHHVYIKDLTPEQARLLRDEIDLNLTLMGR